MFSIVVIKTMTKSNLGTEERDYFILQFTLYPGRKAGQELEADTEAEPKSLEEHSRLTCSP